MVIAVLERRAEIGLRRSLAATREHCTQFFTEPLQRRNSALTGGDPVYATLQNWPPAVPAWAVAGGITAALISGGLVGLYPAIRAVRVAPTQALATT